MQAVVSFLLDDHPVTIDFSRESRPRPTTTVLNYLRSLPDHKGVKEGCAEGDCGACTVVLAELNGPDRLTYQAVNSCLIFLPMLQGKQLITVENLKSPDGELHPVQQALADNHGSQCGFCTPGVVMSIFALYKSGKPAAPEVIEDALTGNLCRCTGYQPIWESARESLAEIKPDRFSQRLPETVKLLQAMAGKSLRIETAEQRYFRPATLNEALALKAAHPEAVPVSGATDVGLRITKDFQHLKMVLDLSGIAELKAIGENPAEFRIGAGAPLNAVLAAVERQFPALASILKVYGAYQIRNLATLGGNLGTASPIGDSGPVLMAYNARLRLESREGAREIPLDEFFLGYRRTVRRPDEIITQIILPGARNGALVSAYKISRRRDLDISTLSAGFRLELDKSGIIRSAKLAWGGMAEQIKRAAETEIFLTGKKWQRSLAEQAGQILREEFSPISDVRGSETFRRTAAGNLLLKFWQETAGQGSSENRIPAGGK